MRIVEQCGCGGSLELVISQAKYAHGLDEEEKQIGLELLETFREQHADHFTPDTTPSVFPVTHWTPAGGTTAPLPDRG